MAKTKKRSDGRYATQIYLGRDEYGRKKYKSVYAKTLAELKEKESAVRVQAGLGLDMLSQRDSFAKWADDWLRTKEAENITDRQKDNYRHAVRVWKDKLDGYTIADVRADDIERVFLWLADEGYARRTVEIYRSTIRQIMKRAVKRGVLAVNPAEQISISIPGREKINRRALTGKEQQWIWDTPHRAQPVAIIMMLSGLRRGELAALAWADVDLNSRTINVSKVVEYSSNGVPTLRYFTKTDAGMRTVDIPQKLVDYMSTLPRDNVLVVHTLDGRTMTPSAWTKLWKSYMKLLNEKYGNGEDLQPDKGLKVLKEPIPPITLHWLRHTFCTIMYLSGVDVLQACAQMGHADVSTTLKIYTHLDAKHKRKSMTKVDDYLNEVSQVSVKSPVNY